MPKSGAERTRASLTRRRQRAREAGLCYTCCKGRPAPGLSICASCNSAALLRNQRKRTRARHAVYLQHIIDAHEKTGDLARDHHLYQDAAQHYQHVINLPAIAQNDRLRITEKLAYAVLLGGDREAAGALFNRLISEYGGAANEPEKIVEMLLQRADLVGSSEALPLLSQGMNIAETTGNQYLLARTHGRMANYFIRAHRYEEAFRHIEAAGEIADTDDTSRRMEHFLQRAILAGAFGRRQEAFETFEYVGQIARKDSNVFIILDVWNSYGIWARTLGDLALFKACAENGLLVARKYHLTTYIPLACLVYAQYFLCTGQYEMAHRYLLEAISYEVQGAGLAVRLARYGIPIALHVKDEGTLAKCARPFALDAAFRTGEPDQITDTAAAFAQWHVAFGRKRDAQKLLHRVTEEVQARIDGAWRFPIIAAQYGSLSDLPQVRTMLEKEDAALLHSDLTQAHLLLFDAFVARRKGEHSKSKEHARVAAALFSPLGWYACVSLARELLPSGAVVMSGVAKTYTAFTHLLAVLSARERQVAELVLQGHGNRAIARMLSITERTVESHMTSILGHLGVRSRQQFMARFIPNQPEQNGPGIER